MNEEITESNDTNVNLPKMLYVEPHEIMGIPTSTKGYIIAGEEHYQAVEIISGLNLQGDFFVRNENNKTVLYCYDDLVVDGINVLGTSHILDNWERPV